MTFSFADASRLTGATSRQLTSWVKDGIVAAGRSPDVQESGLSFVHLLQAGVATELGRVGAPAHVVRSITRYIEWLESEGWKDPGAAAGAYFRNEAPGIPAVIREAGGATRRDAAPRDPAHKAESERFFQLADNAYRQLVRDAWVWAAFRDPRERVRMRWLGVAYTFEPLAQDALTHILGIVPEDVARQGGVGSTFLIIVRRGGAVRIEWCARGAIIVRIDPLLAALEGATGTSLDGSDLTPAPEDR